MDEMKKSRICYARMRRLQGGGKDDLVEEERSKRGLLEVERDTSVFILTESDVKILPERKGYSQFNDSDRTEKSGSTYLETLSSSTLEEVVENALNRSRHHTVISQSSMINERMQNSQR
jgi:hypothetical protein